ncbi:hypothetical protein [Methylobacterium aquaticum]|uniref:hypothetical protein n=1 Tax=Methylobacterium aquaticum TaxID=270351 RepID=UPI0011AE5982|nr:hypothetical protein [Methylobacterium aquaticum]
MYASREISRKTLAKRLRCTEEEAEAMGIGLHGPPSKRRAHVVGTHRRLNEVMTPERILADPALTERYAPYGLHEGTPVAKFLRTWKDKFDRDTKGGVYACPYCSREHVHGSFGGHRVAHCSDADAPFVNWGRSGYWCEEKK